MWICVIELAVTAFDYLFEAGFNLGVGIGVAVYRVQTAVKTAKYAHKLLAGQY